MKNSARIGTDSSADERNINFNKFAGDADEVEFEKPV